ncbi:tRNA (adenosine(37)-N6)-dimethylallyltransferase MiaA [Devosia sp.]|uniref:tRNA (adenosine(37)-N6)-dimethylallyltransferase MiaA n=1 Tax=Devosia sp. TaxID=1871048 RepID=UPI002F0C0584
MGRRPRKQAVLIAGPTASGKSALALETARRTGAAIINADAMQVYDVLRVVTARPSPEEMREVPHRLYGTVPPGVRFSTGDWLRAVAAILDTADLAGRPLLFVGGTGLYFHALLKGFADVPAVPAAITQRVEAQVAGLDRAGRERLLAERDPAMAARLQAHDPQRVVRALAVLEATGRSLAAFQDEARPALLAGFEIERLVLNPERSVLRERIARRFAAMFESGAVEEVEALLALDLDPCLPAMKAIGVREIADWLAGRATQEEAIERAVTATRQYAKRQRTWMRNRMGDWTWIDPLTPAR